MDDIKVRNNPIRSKNSPNPDFRRMNIEKSGQNETNTEDYSLMYGVAAGWDTATFIVGAVPGVGWVANIAMFGGALLNLYLMSLSRGHTNQDFWDAYKYVFIEPIPYLNIIPTFTRGVYLLKHKEAGFFGGVDKMLGV